MGEQNISEFKEMILEELFEVNERLIILQENVKAAAFAEKKSEPELEAEKPAALDLTKDDTIIGADPIHSPKPRSADRYAICGAMGTPAQPYPARMNEPITGIRDEVTCPECLKILAEQEKS